MKTIAHAVRRFSLFIVLFAATGATIAASYNIEMVVFERPGGGDNAYWPVNTTEPDQGKAVGNIADLKAGPQSLEPVAYTLRQKGMVILDHVSWYQDPRGRNSHDWYTVEGTRLNGLVRVTEGRDLHLDTDLVLRDAFSSRTYRVTQHRRLRTGELHYLDHPRLGIIVRAVKIEQSATSVNRDLDTGEPRPAEPRS
ncbi:CsiV family protein [Thiosocius teredinicola]|uniref:CsiV family protein n=1 Tax=Thiosocius teredinicola TaxID=1973002 RepID=UPI000F7A0CF1